MLTENDRTIEDAETRLSEALAGGARHIGFKDVGLPLDRLKLLADQIRLAGGSLFCSIDTRHGTQEDRELYVDKETGNIHIGFSILTE